MFQEIMSTMAKFATPEVGAVFGALAAAWIGWKLTAKGIGLVGLLAQRASFLGMAAAVLFVSGVGTAGLGTGEIASRITNRSSTPDPVGMSDDTLVKLSEKCHDKELAKLITEYARDRDGAKNEDTRILAALVEKAQGRTGDGDKDSKALIAYMEYMKAKEQVKLHKAEVNTALVLSTTGIVANNPEVAAAKEEVKNKDSLMSMPTSFTLMGIGLALSICGIACWNMKKSTPSYNRV
jgi:hypothetical protein